MTQANDKFKPDQAASGSRYKLLDRTIAQHQSSGYALIEVLHAAQGIFGYLEKDLLTYIAHKLKSPLSHVYGVATFYHHFRLKPSGEHVFVLCTGTACYVKGAGAIQQAVEHHCKTGFGDTTPDGKVSLVCARCVGACGLAPVATLDDAVVGKLTPEGAVERIRQWEQDSEEVSA